MVITTGVSHYFLTDGRENIPMSIEEVEENTFHPGLIVKGFLFPSKTNFLFPSETTKNKMASFDCTVNLAIKDVIFNCPATIVIWKDGTKTVVKCQPGDVYDREKGLALCIVKKCMGNKGNFNNVFKKYIKED